MLQTLPSALEKFGSTPLKLWGACERRVSSVLSQSYKERALEVSQMCSGDVCMCVVVVVVVVGGGGGD